MRDARGGVSAGALIVFALAYFLDDTGILSALIPAAAAHEAGHLAAIYACGGRARRLRLTFFGMELGYSGALSDRQRILCAAAGPAAGALYAAAASRLGSDFFNMSAAESLLLTLFNLVPVMPLDGGRIAETLCGGSCRGLSLASAAVLTAGGLAVLLRSGSPALLLAGGWLLAYNAV